MPHAPDRHLLGAQVGVVPSHFGMEFVLGRLEKTLSIFASFVDPHPGQVAFSLPRCRNSNSTSHEPHFYS